MIDPVEITKSEEFGGTRRDRLPHRFPRPKRGSRSHRLWLGNMVGALATVVAAAVGSAATAVAQATAGRDGSDESAAVMRFESEPQTGDLDAIKQRGTVRILVSYNRTNFFIADGQAHGFEYELTKAYGTSLNREEERDSRIQMVYVPVPFDQLIPALQSGRGDLVAAGLTVTPARSGLVQFSQPYLPTVDEIVVANKDVKGLDEIDDLSGRDVTLVEGSSFVAHVKTLNEDFVRRGKPPIGIRVAPPEFEVEDILELVNSGVVDLTVADSHVGRIWVGVLPNIVAYPGLSVSQGGKIAWAVRKDSPQLLASVNTFLSKNRRGTTLGNILFKRYYTDRKWITDPLAADKTKLLGEYTPLFKEFAAKYDFDWQLIAALAYQESQLDQDRHSNRGAIGLMQIKPETSRSPDIDIQNVTDARNNVHAGVKYLALLRDRYFSESAIGPAARVRFALAAYNAGPGNISKMREIAASEQRNPDKWFGNVADVALRHIGAQPVIYVSNINKYYYAYRLADEELAHRGGELDALEAKGKGN
jgi:membrane-bound lytic murein transglycosylase MltF